MSYKYLPLKNKASGELHQRSIKSAERLELSDYEPRDMFERMKKNTWQGDTEGRLLLGQVLLARALKRKSKPLEEIIRLWPEYINAKGYFGDIHIDGINEQQVSSHGWVLRALSELQEWRKDEWSLQQMKDIIEHLALPCKGAYSKYPIDKRKEINDGLYSGHTTGQIGKWKLSTDIGCAFIFMDGVIHAYSHLGGDELRMLCEEMIQRFLQMDILDMGLQTHATLTGLRGLLRFNGLHPEYGDLLKEVKIRFDLYMNHGMTETWANHNWFNKPGWTEPCAIVDSLQVARQLWELTEEVKYRDIWQLIRWNGMAHGQRINSGFGPDSCSGSSHEHGGSEHFLRPSTPEAHWCCTMRGAEGLADLILHQVVKAVDKENDIYLPLMESFEIKAGEDNSIQGGALSLKSEYPWEGKWTLTYNMFENMSEKGSGLKVFLAAPTWCRDWKVDGKSVSPVDGWLILNLEDTVGLADGASHSIQCEIQMVKQETLGKQNLQGLHAWRHGPVILGRMGTDVQSIHAQPKYKSEKIFEVEGEAFVPVSEDWQLPLSTNEDKKSQFSKWSKQVLFQ